MAHTFRFMYKLYVFHNHFALSNPMFRFSHNKVQWGSNKLHRNIRIQNPLRDIVMADPKVKEILEPLSASVKEQGNLVQKLKLSRASEIDLKNAIAELKLRKKAFEDKEDSLAPPDEFFDRAKMEDLTKRRFYYDQSFTIYGGISGLYDLGPIGCALQNNIIELWRKFFILQEQMFEVDCSILSPERVLEASGHVHKFADLITKDEKTGEFFRLDHLIKLHLEKVQTKKDIKTELKKEICDILIKLDGMSADEMVSLLERFKINTSVDGNQLTPPSEFNLMFNTHIGPSNLVKGYLRPETSQGIFVNFKKLLDYNQGRLPFAAAQIGKAFRNEISPRSSLLRLREFTMCEIEHFCITKEHSKFESVKNLSIILYSAQNQELGKSAEIMTIGDAVTRGIVNNQTLGYFMARIYLYLTAVGIDCNKIRFRQHMDKEMAHYASDCWDAECLSSYGWIECVGCADRSAYDLTQHSKATGKQLTAEKKLVVPKQIEILQVTPDEAAIYKIFKKSTKVICESVAVLDSEAIEELQAKFENDEDYILSTSIGEFRLSKNLVSVTNSKRTVHLEEIIPSVIEPSFGISRILYCILEHNFKKRENEHRTYFSFPGTIAPTKCAILPLLHNEKMQRYVTELSQKLTDDEVSHKVDNLSGSIGRRYCRTDELGIPYAITIDCDTLQEPHTVTLRERDSMDQVRLPIIDASMVVRNLVHGKILWTRVEQNYPKFEKQEGT